MAFAYVSFQGIGQTSARTPYRRDPMVGVPVRDPAVGPWDLHQCCASVRPTIATGAVCGLRDHVPGAVLAELSAWRYRDVSLWVRLRDEATRAAQVARQ